MSDLTTDKWPAIIIVAESERKPSEHSCSVGVPGDLTLANRMNRLQERSDPVSFPLI